jgi:biopolymer transport protein ExbD
MISPYPAYQEEKTDIDLAPMLDIVFIMLIFFIVTASFIKEAGVPVTLPPVAIDSTDPVDAIAVTVEPGGVFNVNGRLLSKDSVIPYVRALHAENPEAPYSVFVIKTSKVGDTVTAVDAGRLIGVDVVPISKAEQ